MHAPGRAAGIRRGQSRASGVWLMLNAILANLEGAKPVGVFQMRMAL